MNTNVIIGAAGAKKKENKLSVINKNGLRGHQIADSIGKLHFLCYTCKKSTAVMLFTILTEIKIKKDKNLSPKNLAIKTNKKIILIMWLNFH